MEFELKSINIELSDKNERYYVVNIIAKETFGKETFNADFNLIYDREQKAIFDFIRKPNISFFGLRSNSSVEYLSNNDEYFISLININNGSRYTTDFKKFYEMHKRTVDEKFNELINKEQFNE